MHPINRLLSLAGLKLIKVPSITRPMGSQKELTRVGKLDIRIPPSNPLFNVYRSYPDFSSELGRIASQVHSKYPDAVCVDVGANVGDTAAVIRSACAAPIVCIEGDRATAQILVENSKALGSVTVKQTYLSDSSGAQRVAISKEGWNSTLVPANGTAAAHTVAFLTLDEVLRDLDLGLIKLLKVDTEGHDGRVLRGSEQILRIGRPVVHFEHNRENLSDLGEDGCAVFDNLRRFGYKTALIWEPRGRFMLRTTLQDKELIDDLHQFVDPQGQPPSIIHYLDICVFHEQDDDLAEKCVDGEREARDQRRGSGPPARF